MNVPLVPLKKSRLALALAGTLLVCSLWMPAMSAFGQQPKAPPDKSKEPNWAAPHHESLLIVGFKSTANAASTRENVHKSVGVGARRHSFRWVGADVVQTKGSMSLKQAADAYLRNPQVEFVELNYIVKLDAVPNDPSFNQLWGLHNTGQSGGVVDVDIDGPEAWNVATGSGRVVVGVIDTGIDYTHPDLAANMWVNVYERNGAAGVDDDSNGIVDDIYGARWTDGTGVPTSGDPYDDNLHGTHCAGTIGAAANNGVGVAGVNWRVQLMALKFLSSGGSGYIADAVSALEYSIEMGADLTSNSWGGGGYSASMYNMIQTAASVGQLFIAAAGNSAMNTDVSPNYPSCYELPNVISVAAIDRYENRAYFSNYGALTVDIGAPGVDVFSTLPNNSYGSLSGTSMATPHVAGAAALLLDFQPTWSADDVKNQLLASATAMPSSSGAMWQSCGRLNLAAALGAKLPPFVRCTPVGPSNDQWQSATAITLGSAITGTSANSTNDGAGCIGENDVWYKFTPQVAGAITVTTCAGASFDTTLTAYNVIGGQPLACNDDACGLQSSIEFPASANVTYFIRVAGYSGATGTFTLSTSAAAAPNAPAGLSATAVSPTQISLSWADVSNETGYTVERSTNGTSFTAIQTLASGVTASSNTGLAAGTQYWYRVRAFNAVGSSPYSNIASAITPRPVPNAPTNLSAVAASKTRINLTWTDTASDETGFKIERSTNPISGFTQIAVVGPNTRAYSNTGLKTKTTYYYRVRAYNSVGNSAYSNTSAARTP